MNKNILILCATLCGLTFTHHAMAQRKIDPTVEVKKDFEGKLLEIHKSKLDTSVDDSLSSFNLDFNYSIFNKPYRDMYEFNPLPSAKIHSPVAEKYPQFFAKIGMGYPVNPFAEIYYQPNLSKKGELYPVTRNTLLLKGHFNGFWGKLPLTGLSESLKTRKLDEKAAAEHSSVGISADYRHIWRGGELSTGIDFGSNHNTYYGFNASGMEDYRQEYGNSSFMRNNFSHTFNTFGINFNIGSVNAKEKGAKFNYKFYVSYRNTTDKIKTPDNDTIFKNNAKFTENLFKLGGEFGPTFGRYNQFLIGVNSETAIYTGYAGYHSGVIEFIPQYKFEKGRFLLNAGVKISVTYSNLDWVNDYHTIFSPHATLSYELVKNNLWVYALADGGNNLNSYSSLLEQNKWVIPSAQIRTSSVPLLLKGGFKGKIYDKFSYEVYFNYTVHKGMLQFVNDSTRNPYFLTGYSNHNEFSVGGELNWKTKEFTAGAKLKYSSYTKGKRAYLTEEGLKPLGYAPFEGYVFAEYNWRERIYIGADVYLRSAAPFYNYTPGDNKMEGFANLGLHAKYVLNRNFAVFIQGGNLLNANIQYHPYYFEKGINFGAGITVKF